MSAVRITESSRMSLSSCCLKTKQSLFTREFFNLSIYNVLSAIKPYITT